MDQLDQLKKDYQRKGEDAQVAYNKRRARSFSRYRMTSAKLWKFMLRPRYHGDHRRQSGAAGLCCRQPRYHAPVHQRFQQQESGDRVGGDAKGLSTRTALVAIHLVRISALADEARKGSDEEDHSFDNRTRVSRGRCGLAGFRAAQAGCTTNRAANQCDPA